MSHIRVRVLSSGTDKLRIEPCQRLDACEPPMPAYSKSAKISTDPAKKLADEIRNTDK